VQSRLSRRLRQTGIRTYDNYVRFVCSDAGIEERQHMISALTTNVSHFFREMHHFDRLRTEVLPPLVARARAGGRVRLWSAGCSQGQEAFSIAMTILDMMPDAADHDIRILASDIDQVVVDFANAALFDLPAAAAIPPTFAAKFTQAIPYGIRIGDLPRRLVSFQRLNLHDPWPMTGRFDVIFCRNVVIYFTPERQSVLWNRFGDIMEPGGWLFVGHSERVSEAATRGMRSAGVTTYQLARSQR
jgi:chemotaxis protein methyltransferase CheR